MQKSIYNGRVASRVSALDIELWDDEEHLSKDELWLRIARHLDPDVRRDLVGWMRCTDSAPEVKTSKSFRNLVREYLVGAAQVINPFPNPPLLPSKTDREALMDDAKSVAKDAALVVALARLLLEENGGGRHGEQRQRRALFAAG